MKNVTLLLILLSFVTSFAFAGNKTAIVKIMRGEAYIVSGKARVKLKVNDWIEAGSTVRTAKKSFVKLVFIDKSQMNIGPSSEIKVERFDRKDAGVIDLVRGKIRSQVSKDYLQIDGKNRSKLFIKTPNAVMGIRGTDFLITTTGKNTAAILFEGSVVFNRLADRKLLDSAKLDDIVDRGVRMFPGEFSAVGEKGAPTIPALLNVQQKEKLEKNKAFVKNNKSAGNARRTIVPAGLSGSVVASTPAIDLPGKQTTKDRASSNPDSYTKGNQVKPANGSFVLIDAAQIIQPGSEAVLDESTNTYIASNSFGEVKLDGTFTPMEDINAKVDIPVANVDNVKADPGMDAGNHSRTGSDISAGTIIGASSGPASAIIDVGTTSRELISPVISPTVGAQSVQIGDSLNDAIKAAPVIDSAVGAADGDDNTTGGTVDAVKETSGGLSRFLDIKK